MSFLQNQIAQNPHKLYVESARQKWSYIEIDEMVQTYAQSLIMGNIQAQDRIIIYLSSGIEIVEIVLACFEIGAIV